MWEGIDQGAAYTFHYMRQHQLPPEVGENLARLALLGTSPCLALLVLVGSVLLWRRSRTLEIRFLLMSFLISAILVESLKFLFSREHPSGWNGPTWQGASFPSSTAMLSAVVYFGLAICWTRALSTPNSQLPRRPSLLVRTCIYAIAVVLVLSIGFSRIYLGHHFPSDVVVGWLGAAVVLLMCRQWVMPAEQALPAPSPETQSTPNAHTHAAVGSERP